MCPSFEAPASFVSQPPSPPVASYALKNTMNELKVSQVQTGFNRVVTANGLDLSIQQKEKCGFIEKIDINVPPSRASMQIVGEKLCVIHALLFVAGINTLLQSLFGTRLPTIIGGSYSYIINIMYIIKDSKRQCFDLSHEGEKARVIHTLLFVAGVNTLLQSLFGTRLPTIVGGSYSYIIHIMYKINDSNLQCFDLSHERFIHSMRAIQGALIVASIIQLFIGYTQAWGIFSRCFSPLSEWLHSSLWLVLASSKNFTWGVMNTIGIERYISSERHEVSATTQTYIYHDGIRFKDNCFHACIHTV